MYSKSEAAQIKKEFWTALQNYMRPIPDAAGAYINWINYKTGIKGIYLQWDAFPAYCAASIEIKHSDSTLRQAYYAKLRALRGQFDEQVGHNWIWEENYEDENGNSISKIALLLPNVSIYNKNTWPAMISFLKENMLLLDSFWKEVKLYFEV